MKLQRKFQHKYENSNSSNSIESLSTLFEAIREYWFNCTSDSESCLHGLLLIDVPFFRLNIIFFESALTLHAHKPARN